MIAEPGKDSWEGMLKTDIDDGPSSASLDSGSHEKWLWHGTSHEATAGISTADFRLNLAGTNAGTLYGRGIYLAEAITKSDEYTKAGGEVWKAGDTITERVALLCLASLGWVNYNDEVRPDPDALVASCTGGSFHSVLGDREKIRGTYREIIVYDENQAYPAYICHYNRGYYVGDPKDGIISWNAWSAIEAIER